MITNIHSHMTVRTIDKSRNTLKESNKEIIKDSNPNNDVSFEKYLEDAIEKERNKLK